MTNDDPWNTTPIPERPSWLTNEIEQSLTNNGLPLDQSGMLMLWQNTQKQLAHFKELEMDFRKVCTSFLTPAKPEGTSNIEIGNGYVAKVVNKYNYKLDSDNDKLWASLDRIGAIGNQGKFIAERLVSWTPNFLKTEYTTLQEEADKGSADAKAILAIVNNEMLTISEAAPTLNIIEPKKGKK